MKIKNIFFFTIVLFTNIIFSCMHTNIFDIGQYVSEDDLSAMQFEYSMISSSKIEKVYTITINEVRYFFSVDTQKTVNFIGTTDSNFVNTDGISIGSSFQNVLKIGTSEMIKHPGWGFSIGLRDGWNAVFFVGESGTDYPPNDQSKVTLFYRNNKIIK